MNTQSNQPIHINPFDGPQELYKAGISTYQSSIDRTIDGKIYGIIYWISHESFPHVYSLPWSNLDIDARNHTVTLKTKAQIDREIKAAAGSSSK